MTDELGKITHKLVPDKAEKVEKLLNPTIKKWFFSRFKAFSLPQLFGVSDIHSRKNVLVSAPTGATKTLTGFLSILNELADSSEKGILKDKIYCIYISPLKALNNDIEKNLREPLEQINELAGKDLGIRVAVRTGDTTAKQKADMLKNPPHILITTPESLGIILSSPKFRENLRGVDWAIIDEIHAIAENKRGVHLSLSLERLQHLSPAMARVGLSATVAPLERIAHYLVGTNRDCKIINVQFIKEMDLKVLSPVPDLINVSYDQMHNAQYELMNKLIQEHKTTLIFTNTRSATERVVHYLKEKYPKNYNSENIHAHHGSLSKEHRFETEEGLRQGKLKAVVSSTSLELGIDIGYVDLVILLGSPKSISRALQRIGRSGHQLHSTTKGRIIVLDRDDLVECSVLLKNAVERKIDKIHIPENALDVLAQQIFGMAIDEVWDEKEAFKLITQSYCYRDLDRKDYQELLSFLAGEFTSLEDRHVYARIWRREGKFGRRGKLARVIYMTNIGTIPDESGVKVKIGERMIGQIAEGFLEKLKRGDIFVLGGNVYMFLFARGLTAQVKPAVGSPPTVPSWFSEMLPLSFDLASSIQSFRGLMEDKFNFGKSKKEILTFINDYLYVDKNGANAIYEYFKEQYDYAEIPNDKELIVEHYTDPERGLKKIIFHTLYGRRVNDCLSRAVAFIISRTQHRDVEIGISDNGFYVSSEKPVNVIKALELLKAKDIDKIMKLAIDKTEVLRRRFRHCAGRSLMILRNYMGRHKNVGRQQVGSMILMAAVKRISEDFSILKEARREVLEDLMDIESTKKIVELIETKKLKISEIQTNIPSPFALNLVVQGYLDILKMEDRQDFLKRMHMNLLAKIALKKGKKGEVDEELMKKIENMDASKDFSYNEFWQDVAKEQERKSNDETEQLKIEVWNLKRVPAYAKTEIINLLDGAKSIRPDVIKAMHDYKEEIDKSWPKKLKKKVFELLKKVE